MLFLSHSRFVVLLAALFFIIGCASGSVRESGSPTVSEAQSEPAKGPKARIVVAQFINNTGDSNDQMRRAAIKMQAEGQRLTRDMMEYQKKMIPYYTELTKWQTKVNQLGEKKAGPPPEVPVFEASSSSPYTADISDPVAGGLRDMMTNAFFNSGKFIVLERQNIDKINWEQEFSQSSKANIKTKIPAGEIEGAELLLLGSLNTLEAEESGGGLGGVFSDAVAMLPFIDTPYTTAAKSAEVSWKNAKVGMEMRLVDPKTSRIVAATTVDGTATHE
ncbi:MAG: hypothetical protein HY758_10870 [Nitrospirae bacterium]|nr:hypothetical protein [Nitrospirota bacterium]